MLIELVHRLDVGVGLTRTRLHLDTQCQRAMGIASHVIDRLQLPLRLNRTDILSQLRIAELELLIAEALSLQCQASIAHVHAVGKGILQWLPEEGIHHGTYCLPLEALVLEL